MKEIFFKLFFLITFSKDLLADVSSNYSANNPKFVNFSKVSRDTLQDSFGPIIYSVLVFRHGDRTPVGTYPKDPYRNYPWPQGYGQLTNPGKLRMNKVGQYFKGRYSFLTGYKYNRKNVIVNSSYMDRCVQSAECFLSGYYPPTSSEIWDPYIYWQPIPVYTIPKKYDNIIQYSKNCPLYKKLFSDISFHDQFRMFYKKYESFFKYIENNTEINLSPHFDKLILNLGIVYDSLLIESTQYNLTLPRWTNSVYPEPLKSLLNQLIRIQLGGHEIKKLLIGPFLKLLLSEMKQKVRNINSGPKLHLFSGHDFNIVYLKVALNIYDNILPHYGSCLAFELRKKNDIHYITAVYENSTETAPYLLNIPACGSYCTLEKFEHLINSLIPQNWESACKGRDLQEEIKILIEKLKILTKTIKNELIAKSIAE